MTCSYLRSERHSPFVPVTPCNSFKLRKWNVYSHIAKTTGQFQGCRMEFTWNWARTWRPTSRPGKGARYTFLWSQVINSSTLWHSSNLSLKKTLGKGDPPPPKINRQISVGVRAQLITHCFLNTLLYPWGSSLLL